MKDKFTDNDSEEKVTLDDFVLPELVTAFCEAYEPLNEWQPDCEIFSYTKLRNLFKAVPVSFGDPFILYKQKLHEAGFKFHIDIATGEYVLYVLRKGY
ncbi:MAG: hypothetical protein Q4A15_04425 [Prevotellaceae bacterium]|nr:hypothetical protein [Prevotellaceae bacterium]